jgi:ligand-binding sensor domain-containing protein
MRVTCLALFLFLLASLRSSAQTTEGVFRTERLSAKDGLSNRWTMCVLQDTKGYIWVGTYDGLNRYDGNDFIVYRPSARGKFPVSADLIIQLAETPDGKILLGTRYGILRFDPETGVFDLLVKSGGSHTVLVLNTGRGDPLLTADGEHSGTLRIYELLPSGKLVPLTKEFPSPGDDFSTVQCDREVAWFWDFKGSYHRLLLKDQTWSRLPVAGSKEVPVDATGYLWLPDGLVLRSFPLPANKRSVRWNRFNLEPGKAAWLYTTDRQAGVRLIRYDLKNGSLKTIIPALKDEKLIEYGIAQPFYPRQCMDEEGTVWLTGFQGLTKVRYTDNLFRHYLSNPVVRIESPPAGTSARQLAEDAAGNIYVQDAQGGFYKIDPVSGTAEKIKLPPISPGNAEKSRVPLGRALDQGSTDALRRVLSVISDRDGSIWFSTPKGLSHHDPVTKQFRHFYFPADLGVLFFPDGNDSIWYVTSEKSYSVDKRTGASRRLTGLHYDQLYYGTMLPEEKTLWGFTDTGLVKINTLNLEARHTSDCTTNLVSNAASLRTGAGSGWARQRAGKSRPKDFCSHQL